MKSPKLTLSGLRQGACAFSKLESNASEPSLYGVSDGKAVGTYVEQKFDNYLSDQYDFDTGNSARGLDFPSIGVDVKVTSINQPQSSSPFRSASQKIFGLGYHLLVFVYDKTDDHKTQTANLNILHTVFVSEERTADFQLTKGIRQILQNDGNEDDLIAFMTEKNLPVDEIGSLALAEEILNNEPKQGYLAISNALQWRLQYSRVIEKAGNVDGLLRVYSDGKI